MNTVVLQKKDDTLQDKRLQLTVRDSKHISLMILPASETSKDMDAVFSLQQSNSPNTVEALRRLAVAMSEDIARDKHEGDKILGDPTLLFEDFKTHNDKLIRQRDLLVTLADTIIQDLYLDKHKEKKFPEYIDHMSNTLLQIRNMV